MPDGASGLEASARRQWAIVWRGPAWDSPGAAAPPPAARRVPCLPAGRDAVSGFSARRSSPSDRASNRNPNGSRRLLGVQAIAARSQPPRHGVASFRCFDIRGLRRKKPRRRPAASDNLAGQACMGGLLRFVNSQLSASEPLALTQHSRFTSVRNLDSRARHAIASRPTPEPPATCARSGNRLRFFSLVQHLCRENASFTNRSRPRDSWPAN